MRGGGTRGARGGARGLGRGGHREQNGRSQAPQTPSSWDTGAGLAETTATSTADWGIVNDDSVQDASAVTGDASNADASTSGAQDAATKPQTNGIHAEKPAEVKPSAPSPASFAAKAGAKVPAAPVKSWAQIAKCAYWMSSFAAF